MMTREEHVAWCKQRANEYIERGEPVEAFTSMASDLGKHPETAEHPGLEIGMMMLVSGLMKTPGQVREFINGFN